MPLSRRAFGAVELEVKAVDDTEDPNGSFYAVLSKPTLDRDGEIVDARAFEPLPARITIDVDHGLTVASVVGSGVPAYEADGTLTVRGTYASIPRAQEVRSLVAEGHIATMSVAFMDGQRSKAKDGEPPHVVKGELLNATFCAVPVNRDALVLAAKSLKAGARNSKTDAEHLQAAHDHMVAAGADCSAAKSLTAKDMGDPDEDPGKLAQAVDAAIDQLVDALQSGDVAFATDLATAAQATVDALLAAMGVEDTPEPDETGTAGTAPKAVAAVAAPAVDEDSPVRARALHLAALAAL